MCFSKEEYNYLKTELQSRENYFNKHNIKIVTAVLTIWTVAVSLYAIIFNTIGSKDLQINVIYLLFFVLNFVLMTPLFLMIPLSIKTKINLNSMASLKSYLMVFYELPTCQNKENICQWEILNRRAISIINKKRNALLNFFKDLIIDLANIEFIIMLIFSFAIFIYTYYMVVDYSINVLLIEENISNFRISLACFIVLWVLVFIIVLYTTSINSNYKKPLKKFCKIYVDEAIKMCILEKTELSSYYEKLGIESES